jgi:glutathione S-transferase
MKRFSAFILCALALAGCGGGQATLPDPSLGGSGSKTAADQYADASDAAESKAGAAVGAAKVAVAQVNESPAKVAASAELKVAEAFLSRPTAEDTAEALARVKKRLAGEDLTKADASLIAFADKLSRERDELWSKFEAEKADNAAKLEAIKKEAEQKVAAAHADRDAAEAARRNYLFAALGVGLFAIGTLLLAFGGLIPGGRVGGVCLMLGGIVSAAVPGLLDKVLNSEWFPWVAGGSLGLIAFVGLAIVARRYLFPPKPIPIVDAASTNPSENESKPAP